MRAFRMIASFVGFHCLLQVAGMSTEVPPPRPRALRELLGGKALASPRQSLRMSPSVQAKKPTYPTLNYAQQNVQVRRRDAPFQQTFLGVPVQIEKVHQNEGPSGHGGPPGQGGLLPGLAWPAPPRPLVKPNETDAERAERIHKSFDRLLTFVEIVGQVDNYVSSKWKNLVKTVSNFYEGEDDPYRVNGKRIYGSCPHMQ